MLRANLKNFIGIIACLTAIVLILTNYDDIALFLIKLSK